MSIFDGDGRPALETSFYFPIDLLFDAENRPLIIDWNNLRVRRVNADGTVETVMGTGFEDFPEDGALAIETPLHHASDIEFDAQGRLFVAGDHVPVVFRVDVDQRVFTVAGGFDYGYGGDGGPALEAELSTPFGVLPDARGGFYVSDVDAHVLRYVDPEGVIHTAAGTGERGYSGDGGPATAAQLAGPSRLRFGPDGALYFCETRNHVVRRLRSDGTIDTVAGSGERGYSGDGGPATTATFNGPYDLRFAPNGDLYVADTGNNVIRRIDGAGIVTTVVGDGEPAFAGDGGPAKTASLRRPSSLFFAPDGALWISDTSNHRVRRVGGFLAASGAPFLKFDERRVEKGFPFSATPSPTTSEMKFGSTLAGRW
jgi:sugar lactone lactonase YvrE